MQTFLPYPDFNKSAKCLDNKRLGKQRVEAWQIFKALTQENYGWKNHPIVKMWKGHELALCYYGAIICKEWINRGFNDSMLMKFCQVAATFETFKIAKKPSWIGREDFHASHRSNLLRKDEEWYSQFGWKEDGSLPYVWAVN